MRGGEGRELAPAVVAQPREVRVEAEEEVGRRDVVVDRRPAGRARGGSAGRTALPIEKWKMQTVSGEETSAVLPERAREVGDARVDELREDVRLVPGRAQLALDRERLVADRVAVARAPRAAGGPSSRPRPRPSPSSRNADHRPRASSPAAPAPRAGRRAAGCGFAAPATSRLSARQLEHEVVEQVDGEAVEVGLARERRDHRRRVPEELLDRPQQRGAPSRRGGRRGRGSSGRWSRESKE